MLMQSMRDIAMRLRDIMLLKRKLLQKIPFTLPFFQRRVRLCGIVVVGNLTVAHIGVEMSPS